MLGACDPVDHEQEINAREAQEGQRTPHLVGAEALGHLAVGGLATCVIVGGREPSGVDLQGPIGPKTFGIGT